VEQLEQDLTALHLLVCLLASDTIRNDRQKQKDGLATLEYILSQEPIAALQRDSDKRLAVHVACEQGLVWDDKVVLHSLARSHVGALKEIDPKSKLFPFLLAATARSTSGNVRSTNSYDMTLVRSESLIDYSKVYICES